MYTINWLAVLFEIPNPASPFTPAGRVVSETEKELADLIKELDIIIEDDTCNRRAISKLDTRQLAQLLFHFGEHIHRTTRARGIDYEFWWNKMT